MKCVWLKNRSDMHLELFLIERFDVSLAAIYLVAASTAQPVPVAPPPTMRTSNGSSRVPPAKC